MSLAIRIYGLDFAESFADASPKPQDGFQLAQGTYAEDCRDIEVAAADVLVAYVNSDNEEAAYSFVGRAIREHGVYAYLCVIVVGAESTNNADRFYGLGASGYLSQTARPGEVLNLCTKIFRKTWWYVSRQQEFCSFVVDRKGRILRGSEAAQRRFGADLLGDQFLRKIEGLSENELPPEHPVSLAMAGKKTVCEDRRLAPSGGDRFLLICSPLMTLSERPSGAALILLDISRQQKLVDAADAFSRTASLHDLYALIVAQANTMGFSRARLYRHDAATDTLLLEAFCGYSDGAKKLRDFSIDVPKDRPSVDTLERRFPRMYVRNDDHPNPRDTDLVKYYKGKPNFAEELDKENVYQWIEAPIWIRDDSTQESRCWGKLSIDAGSTGVTLTSRDVADAGVFAHAVATAIASRTRLDAERERIDAERDRIDAEVGRATLLRETSREVVERLKGAEAFCDVLQLTLRFYQKLTGADVVCYREYDGDASGRVYLVGPDNIFSNERLTDEIKVPRELSRNDVDGCFELFRGRPDGHVDPRPQIVANPHDASMQILEHSHDELSEKEQEYLKRIASELQIPVVRAGKVMGVVVAVSFQEGAFSESVRAGIEQVFYVVSSWVELARSHSAQLWAEEVLTEVGGVLPAIAAVDLDKDDALLAGVAAILTSHHGLRWNRAFLFLSSENQAIDSCELKYALGGLVTSQDDHRRLQRELAADSRLGSLKQLVAIRMENPEPHWKSADERRTLVDQLYELCIEKQRKLEPPYLVKWNDFQLVDVDQIPGGRPESLEGSLDPSLWWMSRVYKDVPMFPSPIAVPLGGQHACRWIEQLANSFEGAFMKDRPVWAFPLWSVRGDAAEVLGVVLVDLSQRAEQPRAQMLSATGVVLGLVADLLAARRERRRMRGWHRALPGLFHGRDLHTVWKEFELQAARLFPGSFPSESSAEKSVLPAVASPGNTHSDAKNQNLGNLPESGDLVKLIKELATKMHRLQTDSTVAREISDLGHFLQQQANVSSAFSVKLQLGPGIDGLTIPCDPLLLGDALKQILENAVEASRPRKANVQISAQLSPSPCDNFRSVLEIKIANDGPAIHPSMQPHLFIDGMTSKKPALDNGRGLPMVRAQLTAFNADIAVANCDDERMGAAFVIRIGLPHAQVPSKTGVSPNAQRAYH